MSNTKIDWCDETINPLGWGCYGPGGTKEKPKICWYCYAKQWAKETPYKVICQDCMDFVPHYHLERLKGLTGKKPKKIFVQSMGDLFGDWVDSFAIQRVINFCSDRQQHTFMFLTKNPSRYFAFKFPENCWLGTTITGPKDLHRNFRTPDNKTFVSIEPLLYHFKNPRLPNDGENTFHHYDLVIVGAMTGPGAIPPKQEWIYSIKHPNIFYKDNIKPYL